VQGAKGDKGDPGEQGTQGIQGLPGSGLYLRQSDVRCYTHQPGASDAAGLFKATATCLGDNVLFLAGGCSNEQDERPSADIAYLGGRVLDSGKGGYECRWRWPLNATAPMPEPAKLNAWVCCVPGLP
jgi:hypothetical protein